MTPFAIENIVYELNERAKAYYKQGMSPDDARRQALIDWRGHLAGSSYRIPDDAEAEQGRFFLPLESA